MAKSRLLFGQKPATPVTLVPVYSRIPVYSRYTGIHGIRLKAIRKLQRYSIPGIREYREYREYGNTGNTREYREYGPTGLY